MIVVTYVLGRHCHLFIIFIVVLHNFMFSDMLQQVPPIHEGSDVVFHIPLFLVISCALLQVLGHVPGLSWCTCRKVHCGELHTTRCLPHSRTLQRRKHKATNRQSLVITYCNWDETVMCNVICISLTKPPSLEWVHIHDHSYPLPSLGSSFSDISKHIMKGVSALLLTKMELTL